MTNLEKIKSYSADEMAHFLTGGDLTDLENLINGPFCQHCLDEHDGECMAESDSECDGCKFGDIEACKWWLEQEANI